MASVNLKNVFKRFSGGNAKGEGNVAVDDISLEIEDHEFLVLVGPSGCGKSTTLRLIAGLEQNTSGEIWIGSRRVDDVAPKDRDIAMVFQNYALYPHMSVYKNMSFGLSLRYGSMWSGGFFSGGVKRVLTKIFDPAKASQMRKRRLGIDQQVRQTANRLGIEHLLDRKPYQLSGGERQRVALGRAIVREPAAFLFDEPLSNLDAKLRQQLRIELKRLHRDLNATMIYVTHDQVEAMTLGDRVAVMNEGKILQVGSPLEIYQQPANLFVAQFIGNVPINLCPGTVKQSKNRICFNVQNKGGEKDLFFEWPTGTSPNLFEASPAIGKKPAGLGQRDVVIGFRPEDVSVVKAGPSTGQSPKKSMPFQFSAVVFEIDQLGESTLVHARPVFENNVANEGTDSFQTTILARIEPDSNLKPNDRIEMTVERDRVLWFDQSTRENILKDNK
jgi:multiple sugar transport system ATP-binding protein